MTARDPSATHHTSVTIPHSEQDSVTDLRETTMSAISAAETEIHHLITALEDEGHHLADQFRTAFNTLRGEVPQLEADAKTDAEQVVATAETQGLIPAEQEAVKDTAALAAEAGHDVVTAVETPAAPSA